MNLKNEELWNTYVVKNTDPYGKACVDVARRVMELLDERPEPLRSGYDDGLLNPHGLICQADKDVDAGGITEYMAGAAAHMVSQCHARGREFQIAWNGDDSEGTKNPAILTIG